MKSSIAYILQSWFDLPIDYLSNRVYPTGYYVHRSPFSIAPVSQYYVQSRTNINFVCLTLTFNEEPSCTTVLEVDLVE